MSRKKILNILIWNMREKILNLKTLEKEKRFDTEETERIEDHETWEFAKNIILFPGGAKTLELYKILHKTAVQNRIISRPLAHCDAACCDGS